MSEKAQLFIRIILKDGKRTYAKPVSGANNRLRPLYALVEGKAEHHAEGSYYLRFTANGARHWKNVGTESVAAVAALKRQVYMLEGLEHGLQHKELPPPKPVRVPGPPRVRWEDGYHEYMLEIEARKSRRTGEVYRLALDGFRKACPEIVYLDEIKRTHIMAYEVYMHRRGNGARTAHGRITCVGTFLRHRGLMDVVKKGDLPTYTQKLVDAYQVEEFCALFAAAELTDRLIFEFFLGSGCREQEVMHMQFTDIDFKSGVVRIREKPEYKWKPKDREERDIPIADELVAKLKAHQGAHPGQKLLFPTRKGKPDGHFLRRLKKLALRAGLNCGRCQSKKGLSCAGHPVCDQWTLHKWRRTYATLLHESGVSIRTIMKWTGHSDLETLLRYLAASDHRSQKTRDLVNKSFLALAS